jgi:4-hydroxy-tetrahydrodipicolinate synthase
MRPLPRKDAHEVRRHLHARHHALHRGWRIDRDAFVAMIEHLVAAGVHGIINGGSTGRILRPVDGGAAGAGHAWRKSVIAGRVALIVGTGAIRLPDSIAMAEHARRSGRMRS